MNLRYKDTVSELQAITLMENRFKRLLSPFGFTLSIPVEFDPRINRKCEVCCFDFHLPYRQNEMSQEVVIPKQFDVHSIRMALLRGNDGLRDFIDMRAEEIILKTMRFVADVTKPEMAVSPK